jgi:hypothetical protein
MRLEPTISIARRTAAALNTVEYLIRFAPERYWPFFVAFQENIYYINEMTARMNISKFLFNVNRMGNRIFYNGVVLSP